MDYILLYVKDPLKSAEFYQNVFDYKIKLQVPENDYCELDTGAVTLGFVKHELAESNLEKGYNKSEEKPGGFEITFERKDLDVYIDRFIKNGGTLYEKTTEKPWGQKIVYLRDLDGHLICIGTPMEE